MKSFDKWWEDYKDFRISPVKEPSAKMICQFAWESSKEEATKEIERLKYELAFGADLLVDMQTQLASSEEEIALLKAQVQLGVDLHEGSKVTIKQLEDKVNTLQCIIRDYRNE
jgi:septal ring factor EnvC (AmiA/AmiB activator)